MMSWSACLQRSATDQLDPPVSARPVASYTISWDTIRNDARGLAHLARTGFYKPTHVKSLSAHAIRSLIAARKKLVGQRVTIDN